MIASQGANVLLGLSFVLTVVLAAVVLWRSIVLSVVELKVARMETALSLYPTLREMTAINERLAHIEGELDSTTQMLTTIQRHLLEDENR